MVGALSIVGSSMVDSHTSPCLCVGTLPTTNMNLKGGGDLVLQRNPNTQKRILKPAGSLELNSSFIDSGHDWWFSVKVLREGIVNQSSRKQKKNQRFRIVNELGGQYEDSFEDVKTVRDLYVMYENLE